MSLIDAIRQTVHKSERPRVGPSTTRQRKIEQENPYLNARRTGMSTSVRSGLLAKCGRCSACWP